MRRTADWKELGQALHQSHYDRLPERHAVDHRALVEVLVLLHDIVPPEALACVPRRRFAHGLPASRHSTATPMADAAIASTSPNGAKPTGLSVDVTTSGRPPTSEATTGTPQASASSALRPNDSV